MFVALKMQRFQDYVCLVTGATRGIGKGIALGLADLGATVYITGRTLKPSGTSIGGSLEETAAEINARGGKAVSVVVDHSEEVQVQKLFDQIRREQHGRLDVLVNNVYSAVPFLLKTAPKAYYDITDYSPGTVWDIVNNVGLKNHYICATLGTRMMMECRKANGGPTNPGLIVNVSSMGGKRYLFNTVYGIGKAALDRMSSDMGVELRRSNANICIISLWPGLVRTEELRESAKVESGDKKPLFDVLNPEITESPELAGRAVAALLTESPNKLLSRSGQVVLVSDIAREFSLRDLDGRSPPDYRALHMLLRLGGFNRLYHFVPGFIRLPRCVFMQMVGWYAG